MKSNGHISFSFAALWAVVITIGGWLGTYYTAQISTNDKIASSKLDQSNINGEVKATLSGITVRLDGNDKRMDRFEAKLDAMLGRLQIDPQPINARYQVISFGTSTTTP